MTKRTSRYILTLALVACCVLIVPAVAAASTAWVSGSAPTVLNGTSCTKPGYSTVQSAINAGAATINVCSGTYPEQLTITKAVKLTAINGTGTATVAMPAAAVDSTTSCDTTGTLKQKDEISICTAGTVSIAGLNVEAIIPLETCADGLYGIFVGEGSTLKATNVAINGASTSVNAFKGCQHGVAVEVGLKQFDNNTENIHIPHEIGHAVLSKVKVSGYQKNGPTVKGETSTLVVSASTITGEGPSPYIAQNGIEVWGATGKITGTTISGNECEVSGVCGSEKTQSSGALFFLAGPGSSLATSTLTGNDFGVYYISESELQPTTAQLAMTGDIFSSNRYEGIILDQGKASLNGSTVKGGKIGVELLQYATPPSEAQTQSSQSTATNDKINEATEAAIKVFSDKAAGDIAGKFTITKSTFSGDATILINESNNFEVVF
jgi:hypothetical protein